MTHPVPKNGQTFMCFATAWVAALLTLICHSYEENITCAHS